MPPDYEAQLRVWAEPPAITEQDRCDNAVSAIRKAINASDTLRTRGITIFAQGSYRNNTNVRNGSDVDIGILCRDTTLYSLPEGVTPETFSLDPGTYEYGQFKNEVEGALVAYFGRAAVTRGNKAFDVHETKYRVDADVAAFFAHRRYLEDGTYLEGVELLPDKEGIRVINWPEQHYTNGCRKNTETGTRFKSVVRVLKAIWNEMTEQGVRAGDVPSFLIECLVWNVPNNRFQNSTFTADVKAALDFLYENTKTDEPCWEWGEVSELKYLFRPDKKWTREQANAFTLAARKYTGPGG